MVNSIPILYPLGQQHYPICNNKKCLQTLPNVPRRWNYCQFRITALTGLKIVYILNISVARYVGNLFMGLCFLSHTCKIILTLHIFTGLSRYPKKDIDKEIQSPSESVWCLNCVVREDPSLFMQVRFISKILCIVTCT